MNGKIKYAESKFCYIKDLVRLIICTIFVENIAALGMNEHSLLIKFDAFLHLYHI